MCQPALARSGFVQVSPERKCTCVARTSGLESISRLEHPACNRETNHKEDSSHAGADFDTHVGRTKKLQRNPLIK